MSNHKPLHATDATASEASKLVHSGKTQELFSNIYTT